MRRKKKKKEKKRKEKKKKKRKEKRKKIIKNKQGSALPDSPTQNPSQQVEHPQTFLSPSLHPPSTHAPPIKPWTGILSWRLLLALREHEFSRRSYQALITWDGIN